MDQIESPRQLSLVEVASILERLMSETEDADQVTAEMSLEITAIKDLHVQKIDRIIQVFDAASYHLKMIEEEQKILAEKAKRLKDRTATLKEYCLATLNAYPNLVFKGKTKKLSSKKNGGKPSLKVTLPVYPKMFPYRVDYAEAEKLGALEYVKLEEFWTINTEELREDLETGKKIPWAKLERGEHLSIT